MNDIESLIDKINIRLDRAFEIIGNKLVESGVSILRNNRKYAWGNLIRAMTYNNLFPLLEIGADVAYSRYVEEGADPHMPPIEPLMQWVLKKQLWKKEWTDETKKRNRGKKILKADWVMQRSKQIAWAIAVNIKKKGIKPLPFLKLAFNQNIDFIRKTIEESFAV